MLISLYKLIIEQQGEAAQALIEQVKQELAFLKALGLSYEQEPDLILGESDPEHSDCNMSASCQIEIRLSLIYDAANLETLIQRGYRTSTLTT